ncbi:hypothetical protein [Nocardia sp. NPDC050406]|uniref:hypothetical protein n=1 Tax=Nocardia sp. NPDC050406 TaxID=3364318 RepID=UPI0037ABA713
MSTPVRGRSTPHFGDVAAALAAFAAAWLAGGTLLMPIRFPWMSEAAPYAVDRLLLGVPEGAAVGVIAAVAVGAVVVTDNRAVTAWMVAGVGMVGLFVNHAVEHNANSAGLLTTLNYVDALCAGLVLGGLGAAVLRRPVPAAAFALGAAAVLVVGNSADPVHGTEVNWHGIEPFPLVASPPLWFIALTLALVAYSGVRAYRTRLTPNAPTELPLSPIYAMVLLVLVVLVVAERLVQESLDVVDIAFAVAAVVIAATVAAFLLPGRDGSGILVALSLTAVSAAQGVMPRPWWSVPLLIVITGLGLFAGVRRASIGMAMTLVAALAAVTPWIDPDRHMVAALASAALAFVVGYGCGTARPVSVRGRILAAAVLFLPSIVTALPAESHSEPLAFAPTDPAAPAWTAFALTVSGAAALALLNKFRPDQNTRTRRTRPTPEPKPATT